jgi:hypothetical protein
VKGGPKPAASPRKNGPRFGVPHFRLRRHYVYSNEPRLRPFSSKHSYPFQSRA